MKQISTISQPAKTINPIHHTVLSTGKFENRNATNPHITKATKIAASAFTLAFTKDSLARSRQYRTKRTGLTCAVLTLRQADNPESLESRRIARDEIIRLFS